VTTLEEGLSVVSGDAFLMGVLALARARQGRTGEAQQIRASLDDREGPRYNPFLPRAFAAEACGDLETADNLLERAIEEREALAAITLADRRAGQPSERDRSLLRKMNLA